MTRIAFLGLGAMGSGMAASLVRGGAKVTGFDPSTDAAQRAAANGVATAPNIAAAVAGAEAVITMLPASAHVRDAYENHIFAAAPPGALLIDSSTIDVATARAVQAGAEARGFAMVDAPVSGGTAAAEQGALTFMVGGSDAAYARAAPLLAPMAKSVVHTGPGGTGQAAKLCNNLILGATMIATCEGFLLAERLGLDAQTFFDVASQSSGQSWSMTSYCPVPGPVPASPANRGYAGGFLSELMLKDLKIAHEEAVRAGLPSPLGAAAEALYAQFTANGGAGRDFSAIIEMLGPTP